MTTLAKKEREAIFRLFLEQELLSFSTIEKAIGIRSNMIAYHLEQLRKDGVIEKRGTKYALTKHGEQYLPVVTQVTAGTVGPIPVVLVAAICKERGVEKVLLVKRTVRPYKGQWGLLGGKMRISETYEETALRLLSEKTGLTGENQKVHAVLQERVIDGIVKHNFLLFFVSITVKRTRKQESLVWRKIIAVGDIIPSDKWLIEHALGKGQKIRSGVMTDDNGTLSFSVKKI